VFWTMRIGGASLPVKSIDSAGSAVHKGQVRSGPNSFPKIGASSLFRPVQSSNAAWTPSSPSSAQLIAGNE